MPPALRQEIKQALLGFKYWIDEPSGPELAYMWNENHSINYHAAQFLAGQFFPEDTFSNTNKNGAWHKQTVRERLLRWIALFTLAADASATRRLSADVAVEIAIPAGAMKDVEIGEDDKAGCCVYLRQRRGDLRNQGALQLRQLRVARRHPRLKMPGAPAVRTFGLRARLGDGTLSSPCGSLPGYAERAALSR